MSRAPRSGSVYQREDGMWMGRIRTADGRRPVVELPMATDRASAERERIETARLLREREARRGHAQVAASDPSGETVAQWADRWFASRRLAGLSSVEADEPRWRKWVGPVLGPLPMAGVTRDDVERLVEHLDAAVRRRAMAWKTAVNAWALVTRAFAEACGGKVRRLRCRADNPTLGVTGPDRGGVRIKAVIFPDELLRFLRSPSVDLSLRRAAAIGVYLGARVGELRALRWEDVDLAHGTVLIHEQVDRRGKRRETKTRRARRVPVEPALLPLLRVLAEESGRTGPVVQHRLPKHLPRVFRAALERCGVTRGDLHVSGKDRARVAVRAHDWRGTFATWCAARGDSLPSIAARAGHETLSTTQGYIEAAELLGGALRGVFPELPAEILGTSAAAATRSAPAPATGGRTVDTKRGKYANPLVGRQGLEPCDLEAVCAPFAGDVARSGVSSERTQDNGRQTSDVPGHAAASHVLDAVRALLESGDIEGARRLAGVRL